MRILYDPWLLNLDVKSTVNDEARCRCPFHSPDRKPSASFNMKTGLFHCYACGANANVTQLARKTGGVALSMPASKQSHFNEKEDWSWLLQMPLAYDNEYLWGRGITNDEVLKYEIVDTGAGIAVPIHDARGKISGFQERRYQGDPKYVLHGERMPIWRMHLRDRIGRTPYIVEGVFGVINAERSGVKAVTTMSAVALAFIGDTLNGFQPIIAFDDDFPGYLAAARGVIAFGFRAIVPGIEADEISIGEWQNLQAFHQVTARVSLLREACGNAPHFDAEIQKFTRKRGYNGRTSAVRGFCAGNARYVSA
jgi:hypothetical protein